MEATEYAPKKPVRAQTIVREVDEARQRELWQWVCTGVVFVVVLLVSVWQQSQFAPHGRDVEFLKTERAREDAIGRDLRLRIERLRAPQRIESLALKDLQMVAPASDQAIVIERVVLPQRPAASVVAAR